MFVLALTIYAFTAGGSLTSTDAVVTFDVTRNIVEQGSVAMSGNLLGLEAHRGRDGRYYAPFGLAQSLYNIPFYLAARAVERATHVRIGKADSLEKAAVAMGNTVVAAAIVWVSFTFAMLLTADLGASAGGALALAFATLLWPYARFGFNQPLAALSLLAATCCAVAGARKGSTRLLALSGLWLSVGLMTRHEGALAAGPIVIWLLADRQVPLATRVRRVLWIAPGLVAGVVAWLGYNAIRFGNPLDSGYLRDPTPGFGSNPIDGAIALLFSPGASLFLYSPIAVVGVGGLIWNCVSPPRDVSRDDAAHGPIEDRSVAALLLSLCAVFVLFYSFLGNWMGGRSYGARYLVMILPLVGLGVALALARVTTRLARRAILALVAVSALVQLPGVLVDYAKASQASTDRINASAPPDLVADRNAGRQWRWDVSPVVLNAVMLRTTLPENLAYLTGRRAPPAIAPPSGDADRGFSQQFAFSLDLWWLYLFYLHILSRPALAVLLITGATVVAASAWSLRRAVAARAR